MKLKIGLCQTKLGMSKIETISNALESLTKAKQAGAKIAILGEMFVCTYDHQSFRREAEPLPALGLLPPYESQSIARRLSDAARSLDMFIIGGSVPESSGQSDRLYNTSLIFDNRGVLVGKYRKCHLFDVNITKNSHGDGVSFKESHTFAPGDLPPCVVETPWGFDVGVGICFDVRFPEFAISLRKISARTKLIVFPSAFNMTTGPMHWTLLAKARALDTQAFIAMASTARSSNTSDFQVWGHSLVVSPYGDLLGELDENAGVLIQEIDLSVADKIRQEIPLMQQRRADLYVP